MKFKLSFFKNKFDNFPRPIERTWQELCSRFGTPEGRIPKEGPLFTPATYARSRRLNENVTELSLLVLDCDHNVAFVSLLRDLRALQTAFAIYSTHSHLRAVYRNRKSEPRFRVVIPLTAPIPVAEFPRLWRWATDIVSLRADEQTKDPARIYYTPAVWRAEADTWIATAPYQFHIEEGPLLNWRAARPPAREGAETPVRCAESSNRVCDRVSGQQGTILSRLDGFVKVQWDNGRAPSLIALDQVSAIHGGDVSPLDFQWFEDRHAELCRRIQNRGKRNSRGHYDAKCLAHAGKGTTSLCYFPHSGAVVCNADCEYNAILRAEGLSDTPLRSLERHQAESARHASRSIPERATPEPAAAATARNDAARISTIYGVLLAHLLYLLPRDAELIARELRTDPYGTEMIEFPGGARQPALIKTCSIPTTAALSIAVGELSKWFDLAGVPGFYRQNVSLPTAPEQIRIGAWTMNLPSRKGLLAPYDNGTGYIVGIRVYLFNEKRRSITASLLRTPFLLSSRNLQGGAPAVAVREEAAA